MPLNERQKPGPWSTSYNETVDIYRADSDKIMASGDPGYKLKYSAVPCKLFTTPNFDEPEGGFAQHKEANIMTSNKLHVCCDIDIQDMDVVHMHSLNVGNTPWFVVNGEPETRQGIANRSQVYLVPTPFDPANIVS